MRRFWKSSSRNCRSPFQKRRNIWNCIRKSKYKKGISNQESLLGGIRWGFFMLLYIENSVKAKITYKLISLFYKNSLLYIYISKRKEDNQYIESTSIQNENNSKKKILFYREKRSCILYIKLTINKAKNLEKYTIHF